MAQIVYALDVPPLPEKWAFQVRSALDKIGLPSIFISSSFRTPEKQAKAMYQNIISKGAASQTALYSQPEGKAVVALAAQLIAHNNPASDTINQMVNKIVSYPENHISAHMITNTEKRIAFDVPPESIPESKRALFEKAFKSLSSKFISPYVNKGEPVYHIEMTTLKELVIEKGVPVVLLLLAGAAIWYFMKHGKINF